MLKSTANKNVAIFWESRIRSAANFWVSKSNSRRKVSFGPILSSNRFRRSGFSASSWFGFGGWSANNEKTRKPAGKARFAVLFRNFLGLCLGIFAVTFGSMYAFPGTFDKFKGRFTFLAARREHTTDGPGISKREKRFLAFASLEFHGEVFMSPRDFIDCVTRDQPRSRLKRKHLTDSEVFEVIKRTPDFSKGTKHLFRRMDADGIVSYTEYLFLLCILTKPEEGFKIAFNMFDTDGDKRVDKKEFLVLENVIGRGRRRLKKRTEKAEKTEKAIVEGQPTSSQIVKAKPGSPRNWVWSKSKEIVTSTKVQETSLLTHFFGPKGNRTLTYDDFRRFMDNLQTEVLEIEFNEFSGGMNNISESDFARILLRYTPVTSEERKSYIRRVHERIPDEGEGITFEQFRLFCRFLNTLDDFTIAVKLYTFADLPVSQAEFARAVKVATGFALEPHVVDVVFKIFDVNNDGRLSYSEFIAVMKERLHRGFRTRTAPTEGWPAFKKCVREELKRY